MTKSPTHGLNSPIIESSSEPALKAGEYINDLLSANAGKQILLMVAGGSARAVLDYIDPEYITKNITVCVTDERYTDDMSENNFDVLQTLPFYEALIASEGYCINTSLLSGRDSSTVEIVAERFQKDLEEWLAEFPKGIIIGLYGMGNDGHTAGIIPGIYKGDDFEAKFNGHNSVTTVIDTEGKSSFPERITTTFSFMRKVNFPVFYITGENKTDMLKKSLSDTIILEEVPARIMKELKGAVIFTDIAI